MSPETLFPDEFSGISGRQTLAGDIYSFACVCIEVCVAYIFTPDLGTLSLGPQYLQLYTGEDPWYGVNRRRVPERVRNGDRPPRPIFHGCFEMIQALWDIVELCWAQSPSERPSADELFKRVSGKIVMYRSELGMNYEDETSEVRITIPFIPR